MPNHRASGNFSTQPGWMNARTGGPVPAFSLIHCRDFPACRTGAGVLQQWYGIYSLPVKLITINT
jgi:hypothetical protein